MKQTPKFDKTLISYLVNCWLFLLLFLILSIHVSAQSYDGLTHLEGFRIKTHYSNGATEQAKIMAGRCAKVLAFYSKHIPFEPDVTLLVLSPQDWGNYTSFPVYGMPHYNNGKLIVASEDNEFWQSFIPPIDKLPKELVEQIIKTYSDEDGNITMKAFFDLLSIHELGHAYHFQAQLTMQRLWMSELFVNMLLHNYIAENEPQLLPVLTIFPELVLSTTDKAGLKFTTLVEFEASYAEIGQKYPINYGWYQSKLLKAAGNVYDEGGLDVLEKLWHTLKEHRQILDDPTFAAILTDHVHQSVADVLLTWDQ